VWPDEKVVKFVNENFLPARVHVKEDADAFKRYGEIYNAHWTPTVLELNPNGEEFFRVEGFLPLEDFLAQLMLGRAHMDFKHGKWAEAEKRFREIVEKLPKSEGAAEAQYWAGVSRYKATNDASALKQTANAFTQHYQDSSWAKKASVWA
jgi:hypothetical protein